MARIKNTKQLKKFVKKVSAEFCDVTILTSSVCSEKQIVDMYKLSCPILLGALTKAKKRRLHHTVAEVLFENGVLSAAVKMEQIIDFYRSCRSDSPHNKVLKKLGHQDLPSLTQQEKDNQSVIQNKWNEYINERLGSGTSRLVPQIACPSLPSDNSETDFMSTGLWKRSVAGRDLKQSLLDLWIYNRRLGEGFPLECLIKTRTGRAFVVYAKGKHIYYRKTKNETIDEVLKVHQEKVEVISDESIFQKKDFTPMMREIGYLSDEFLEFMGRFGAMVEQEHDALFG